MFGGMSTSAPVEREKLITAMAPELRRQLKIRASERDLALQEAAELAIGDWLATPGHRPVEIKPDVHRPWGTYLPVGMPAAFKDACNTRGVTYIQGLAQAVSCWIAGLTPAMAAMGQPVLRVVVCNQKGGVGKTFLSGGLAQGLAEMGLRVLLVDYDPQGHLTQGMGLELIDEDDISLLDHMTGQAKGHDLRELLVTLPQPRFGGRLDVLPACIDAYLADALLGQVRVSHTSVERALAPIEVDYDAVVFDGPPSLGMALDAALYYCRRREVERAQRSGVLIPVNADIYSYNAYKMLRRQIDDLAVDADADIDYLGLVLNEYDSRQGQVVQRSHNSWLEFVDPGVLVVIKALKEPKEAAAAKTPLLEYAPSSEHATVMRELAKEVAA
jgi:chromosome partitioning protein